MLKTTKKKTGTHDVSEQFSILANKTASSINIDYALANIFNPDDFMTILGNAYEAMMVIKALYYFAAAGDEREFAIAKEAVMKMKATMDETIITCEDILQQTLKKRIAKQDTRH